VKPAQQDHGRLEIEIASRRGLRPVRLTFAEDGQLYATGHEWEYWLFGYKADQWVSVEVKIDLDQPTWQLAINGTITKEFQWANEPDRLMDGPVSAVERISFRTGKFRRLGKGIPAQMTFLPSGVDSYEGVARGSDRPITPAVYYLDDVRIDAGAAYGKTGKNAEKAGNTGL
jgi:hypothetical protein